MHAATIVTESWAENDKHHPLQMKHEAVLVCVCVYFIIIYMIRAFTHVVIHSVTVQII